MKNFFSREILLSLGLLISGATIPVAVLTYCPTPSVFDTDLYYWYAAFLTLSGALAAVKLTFSRLIEINPKIDLEMIFESATDLNSQQALLQAHARTAELMIMGITLFGLVAGTAPDSFASVLLFASLRIGAVLFLLGGIVMIITHLKMKKL